MVKEAEIWEDIKLKYLYKYIKILNRKEYKIYFCFFRDFKVGDFCIL